MKQLKLVLGLAVVLAACSDSPGPGAPGNIAVRSASATAARAVLLKVVGPVTGAATTPSTAYKVYSSSHGDTTLIMVIAAAHKTLGTGSLALIPVVDTRATGRYSVTPVQASDTANVLIDRPGFALSIGAP